MTDLLAEIRALHEEWGEVDVELLEPLTMWEDLGRILAGGQAEPSDEPRTIESLIRWMHNTVDPVQDGPTVRLQCVALVRRFAAAVSGEQR